MKRAIIALSSQEQYDLFPGFIMAENAEKETDIESIIQQTGIEIRNTKSYGCGVDCHSKFIQICVIVKIDNHLFKYEKEYGTDWDSLKKAKEWVLNVLHTCPSPPIPDEEMYHYCIESTSTYHKPVLLAWKGVPAVINPSIAGATKRKTDVLDSELLAIQDYTSIWRDSYIVPTEVEELRILIAEKNSYSKLATRANNRINTNLIKFGANMGREGSVTKDKDVREAVCSLLSDHPDTEQYNVCPDGIPESVRAALLEEYKNFDEYSASKERYAGIIRNKAEEIEWETTGGTISGEYLIPILMTAPGVGFDTAIAWLATIVTPFRFPNAKAVSAYCGLDPSLKVSAKKVTSTKKRGGNKAIHSALCMSAGNLMKNHSEPFGKWGYNIYLRTGKWKKGTNAVARRLAIALYYMQIRCETFSYDEYRLVQQATVIDIPLDTLAKMNPDFKRYVPILKNHGISTTTEMVNSYYKCSLKEYKGLGRKFYTSVKEFIDQQKNYRKLYKEYLKEENS